MGEYRYGRSLEGDTRHLADVTGKTPSMVFPVMIFLVVVGFWPAFIWHGEGGPTGTSFEWNGASWLSCGVWWGLLACVAILIKLAGRKPKLKQDRAELRRARQAFPPPGVPYRTDENGRVILLVPHADHRRP